MHGGGVRQPEVADLGPHQCPAGEELTNPPPPPHPPNPDLPRLASTSSLCPGRSCVASKALLHVV
jgi:hypothetical protein